MNLSQTQVKRLMCQPNSRDIYEKLLHHYNQAQQDAAFANESFNHGVMIGLDLAMQIIFENQE